MQGHEKRALLNARPSGLRQYLPDLRDTRIIWSLLHKSTELLYCLIPSIEAHQYIRAHEVHIRKVIRDQVQLAERKHVALLAIPGLGEFELGLPELWLNL